MLKSLLLVTTFLVSSVGFAQTNPPTAPQDASHKEVVKDEEDDGMSGHFVIGAYINTLSQMKFDDAKVTSGGTTTSQEYELKTDASIGGDAHFLFWGQDTWGFSVGGFFDLSHKIKSESMTIYSATKDAYLGLIGFEANAIYRWDTFYIPFGFNTAVPVLMDEEGEVTDLKAGVGLQAGAGWLLGSGKHNVIEAKIRTTSFQYTQTINNVKLESGRGTGAGLTVGWKYIF